MLRKAVLAFATLLAAIGVYLLLKGITVPGVQALGVGIIIILGTLFERSLNSERRSLIGALDR